MHFIYYVKKDHLEIIKYFIKNTSINIIKKNFFDETELHFICKIDILI